MSFLLLHFAAVDNKAKGKEAEDKGVFFGFGDDGTVEDEPHRALRIRRKTGGRSVATEGSRKEVADGLVDQSGAHPSRRLAGGIGQIAPGDTNSKIISLIVILIHKKMRNGSAAAADGDGGRVGDVGGKSDVGLATARNSGGYGLDVFGVGTRKQGRKREVDVAGFVGVKNVSAILYRFKSISRIESIGSCSDVTTATSGAGEDPEGLVGVVSTGEDV